MIKILGMAGSIREGAYSRAALLAALFQVPQDSILDIFESLAKIPPYNQDQERDPPKAVQLFKQKVRAADAILFVTPEYNYSIPGILKNAIDWGSRPYGDNVWEGKPVAIISSSTGMLGGARAQYQLRQMFVFLNMFPINRPEVMIPNAQDKFDEKGELNDDYTKDKIRDLLSALVDWTIKLKG